MNMTNKEKQLYKRINELQLEGFVLDNLHNDEQINYAFIGLGQGGGSVSVNFQKLGFYSSFFNTAKSDLSAVIETLKEYNDDYPTETIEKSKYEISTPAYRVTPFGTLGGAKKDRYFGKEAVMGNLQLIKDRLITDKKIYKADYVWVVAALGGGTASGAVTDIVRFVSGFVRKNEKRFTYVAPSESSPGKQGYPTVGVIALWPEATSSPKVQLNAAEALEELTGLHDQGLLGNVLLIENQKLLDDAIENNIDDWQQHGNSRIVQYLTEATVLPSMSSKNSVDRAEMMELITTPGFINITKNKVVDFKTEKINDIAERMIDNSMFASLYERDEALKTVTMTLSSESHSTFTKTAFSQLTGSVSQLQDSVIVNHEGMYVLKESTDTNSQLLKQQLETKYSVSNITQEELTLYHLSVYKNAPRSIIERIHRSIEKRNKDREKLQGIDKVTKGFNLDNNDIQMNSFDLGENMSFEDFATNSQNLEEGDHFDLDTFDSFATNTSKSNVFKADRFFKEKVSNE
ncbi:MAG: hypothetical protein JEZ08_22530 [Clostridiales bacterium]|nr:hypothetical protein [Clostridiales bacterium]